MKLLPLFFAGAILTPALSSAGLIYGLTSTNGLVRFDSSSPGTVTNLGTISQTGIVDLDFYPANGVLYGAVSDGRLYRINTADGSATLAVTPASAITGVTDFDFNPSADRARIFATSSTNFRLVPDIITAPNTGTPGAVISDGTFTFASSFSLVSSAYSGNIDAGPTNPTTLYSLDATGDRLLRHSTTAGVDPAGSFNTLNLVGPLGFDLGTNAGFDIDQAGIAFVSNGNSLFTVNLTDGSTAALGTYGGPGNLVSIAAVAVPEASTASVVLLAGLSTLRRRRRIS